jgi:hypothetical protein
VSPHRFWRNWVIAGLFFYVLAIFLLRTYFQPARVLLLDVAIGLGLFIGWVFFFSQFVLPVQGWQRRLQIFWRVLLFWWRGPVIFVENGIPRERAGESQRRGPGVLWLDSASGGVIRNAVRFVRPIGPGVHFTSPGEYPAGFVDLHAQVHTIGPNQNDQPFESTDAEVQARRLATSGLTRDGNEVVCTLSVIFKIDAEPARGERPGSRFGYHPESVLRAIRGEGMEVQVRQGGARRVRWNQLPALLAADLWREYLAKFTLDELFQEQEWTFPEPPPPPSPRLDETTAYYRPFRAVKPQRGVQGALAEMLHVINRFLEARLQRYLEAFRPPSTEDTVMGRPAAPSTTTSYRETALQMIQRMVLWRLQHPQVPQLDNHGRYTGQMQPSPEFELLQERGLRVRAVNIANIRFPEKIEEGLLQGWTASWLERARKEHQQIEQQRAITQVQAQERALIEYATRLSRDLEGVQSSGHDVNVNQTLRALLQRSRRELQRDPALQQRATNEIVQIDEILQWLESNP